ncbi:MAG: outer membrane protein assembly factor BamA [Candidatus Latescibacterota bacterium]
MRAARPLQLWLCGALVLLLVGTALAEKIVQIEVRGELRKVAESLILSTVSLKPGEELSGEGVQKAVRDLQGLNVFSDIQIFREPVEGGARVIIVVTELPTLQGVRFKGNEHLGEKEMKEALGLVKGQVVAPWEVTRGEQKILELYRDKGYLRARVEGKLFEAEEPGTTYLQYDIAEGQKVKIEAIRIRLQHADGTTSEELELPYSSRRPGAVSPAEEPGLPVRAVKRVMTTKEKRWYRKGEFKRDVYDEDKEKILALYRQHGYQQAHITHDSVYYDSTRRDLYIDMAIEEGRKNLLGKVRFAGQALFTEEELAAKLRLRPGDVYRLSAQELADLVRQAYFEKGYLDTRVLPEEVIHGDTASVSFQIFEGQPWTIRRVNIAGNTKTREKVIRREIEVRPGDIYQQNLVQESQRRIYMLNFFRDVQVQPDYSPVEDERNVDLTFQVEERPTGQASMGAGYSDRDKLVGQIGLQIPNFRGMGQNLDFSWEFGTRREQFLVGFTEPWLLDTPTSLSTRVYTLTQQYYNYYDYKRNAINLSVGRRLKKPAFSSLSAGYRLESTRYSDFDSTYAEAQNDSRYAPRTTSSFSLTYQRDTRDMAQFPTRGTLISYQPEVATSFVGGDVDFHRHELNLNYYRPSWWKFTWSLETKVAIVDGFSAYDDRNIPWYERFTPGGVDWWDGQVRGYADQSLGPRVSGLPIGGNSMMVLNLEYRFPLAEQQVYGLLFADAGNAWARISDLNPLELRKSAGFGFRIMTPMLGLIGFDFGYGFDREKVDGTPAGWTTHFQFGPRFF